MTGFLVRKITVFSIFFNQQTIALVTLNNVLGSCHFCIHLRCFYFRIDLQFSEYANLPILGGVCSLRSCNLSTPVEKIAADFPTLETKPPLANQKSVVYYCNCDLCDADYVGYTCRHLHQRIGRSMKIQRRLRKTFKVLRKCGEKFEGLLYEKLFIKDLKPSLNKQSDSICSKLFILNIFYLYICLFMCVE